jgi:hypothetical protein
MAPRSFWEVWALGREGSERDRRWLSGVALLSLAVVATVLVAALTLRGGPGAPSEQPSAGARNNRCWRFKPSERAFVKKMNKARGGGRGKLRIDPELSKAARKHTGEMIHKNLLYHTTPTQLRHRIVRWSLLGENVGVGNTVSSLHKAFMHSPGHRANILRSSFNHSGVGVRNAHGRMWVTVIFESRQNPGTRLRMPRC